MDNCRHRDEGRQVIAKKGLNASATGGKVALDLVTPERRFLKL